MLLVLLVMHYPQHYLPEAKKFPNITIKYIQGTSSPKQLEIPFSLSGHLNINNKHD